MDVLCILHGFSVELPCVVLQIHLHVILFQCLMILPSFTPCYTVICITFLMLFIPLTLTPGSLFYSLVYLVYCLTLSPPTSAQETHLLFTSSDDVLEQYTGTRKSYLNVEAISVPLQKACVDLHGHGPTWI